MPRQFALALAVGLASLLPYWPISPSPRRPEKKEVKGAAHRRQEARPWRRSAPPEAAKATLMHVHRDAVDSDGSKFDSSLDRGTSRSSSRLGVGQVIKGCGTRPDRHVQGRRNGRLVIPGHLGYGESGSPPKIPATRPSCSKSNCWTLSAKDSEDVQARRCRRAVTV
uniref:peptidylprolyl isomerase n=1 Tax=Macrostomum lignano TaxID=282301 RepID=A0A1I8F8I5_9PLAT